MPLTAGRTLRLTATADNANVSSLLIFAAGPPRPDERARHVEGADDAPGSMPPMVLMSRSRHSRSRRSSARPWTGTTRCAASPDPATWRTLSGNDYQQRPQCLAAEARELFLLELAKYGLGEADLHGWVNFFSKVTARDDERCSLTFEPAAVAGDVVVRCAPSRTCWSSCAPVRTHSIRLRSGLAGVRVEIRDARSLAPGRRRPRPSAPESARALRADQKGLRMTSTAAPAVPESLQLRRARGTGCRSSAPATASSAPCPAGGRFRIVDLEGNQAPTPCSTTRRTSTTATALSTPSASRARST